MALRKAPLALVPSTADADIHLVRTSIRRQPRTPWDSFFTRVLAGSLLVSLPVVAVLGFLTFQEGVQTSTDAATARGQATAEAAAIRIGAWLGERKAELRHIAEDSSSRTGHPAITALVARPIGADPAFEAIEIVSVTGKVLAATAGF